MKTIKRILISSGSVVVLVAALLTLTGSIDAYSQAEIETGIIIFENKNYYGAEKFFSDYLLKYPSNADAHFYLGRIAFENKKNEEASGFFEKATDLDKNNPVYFTWKGINYITILQQVDFLRQGLYASKALSALETAVDLDSMNTLARLYLSGYYANAPGFAGGSREKAIDQVNIAAGIDSMDTGILLQRGIIMATFGEYVEAKNSFEKIMSINPEFYPSYFQMGKMCSENGVYMVQGEMCLSRFISSAPAALSDSLDEAWWFLGNLYARTGRNEEAKTAFEKAVALDPQNENFRKSLKSLM